MNIPNTALLLLSLLMTACASPMTTQDNNQQQIHARYQQARLMYQNNMAPMAQHFIKTCSPLSDPEYLDCINGKRGEIAVINIYPETAAAGEQRLKLEKMLLNGDIDRKQFRHQLEALKANDDARQLELDVTSGHYSGRY